MDISMLREALGETLYAQAQERLSDVEGLLVIPTDDGTWLPKGRLDAEIAKRRELQEAVDGLNGQLAEAQAQLEACRAALGEADRLRMELEAERRGEGLRDALRQAGARDVALVEKLLDPAGDIDAQVAQLKERSPYLFEDARAFSRGGFGGGRGMRPAGIHADVNSAIRAAAGRRGY